MTTNISALENRALEEINYEVFKQHPERVTNTLMNGYTKMVHKATNDGVYDVLAICLRETCYFWADRCNREELMEGAFGEIETALEAIFGPDRKASLKVLREFWIEAVEGYKLHILVHPEQSVGRRASPDMKVPVTVDITKVKAPLLDLGTWEFNVSPSASSKHPLKYHLGDILYTLARKLLDKQYGPLLNLYDLNKEHMLTLSVLDPDDEMTEVVEE